MIEVLVGMIASGKSTYAKGRAAEGAIIVNDDALVIALHGGRYDMYAQALKPLYKAMESAAVHAAIAAGRDVVIDRTNLSRETRAFYVALARRLDTSAGVVVWMPGTPEQHATSRFRSDARGYTYAQWLAVAERHLAGYQPVLPDEGFSVIKDGAAWT